MCIRDRIQTKIKRSDYLTNLSHEDICKVMNDITNVYYWVTRFKDERMKFIKSLKPTRPIVKTNIYPNCLISTIEKMIPNWMNNNENMNLFLIKVSF